MVDLGCRPTFLSYASTRSSREREALAFVLQLLRYPSKGYPQAGQVIGQKKTAAYLESSVEALTLEFENQGRKVARLRPLGVTLYFFFLRKHVFFCVVSKTIEVIFY